MFGISGEHLLILAIVLIIFGPRRLPELGNTLGKAIKNFKDSISGIEEASYRKIDSPEPQPESNKEHEMKPVVHHTQSFSAPSNVPQEAPPPERRA